MVEKLTPSSPNSRIIDPGITLQLANGKSLTGRLEYFIPSKNLVVFDDDSLEPVTLTVLVAEAPSEHAALGSDEVLLRNWTDLRGAPAALAGVGIVELTGQEVKVGMFRLQALVARLL
ncbi:hypothetical protein [Cryobacterium zhongshanensis]|uniref:Uncharacterized protein n=1 Tax=Cryobacterium zhongshanensis TaxID=2928153 RepID=A0AA41QY99_9MICO|nr:hypothetical protein [Cryobacterium zhongshanensis]MCI4659760.1 hypothetical protein [Cryobacterium zhongshanensis]